LSEIATVILTFYSISFIVKVLSGHLDVKIIITVMCLVLGTLLYLISYYVDHFNFFQHIGGILTVSSVLFFLGVILYYVGIGLGFVQDRLFYWVGLADNLSPYDPGIFIFGGYFFTAIELAILIIVSAWVRLNIKWTNNILEKKK
jgi:hypothetical protein